MPATYEQPDHGRCPPIGEVWARKGEMLTGMARLTFNPLPRALCPASVNGLNVTIRGTPDPSSLGLVYRCKIYVVDEYLGRSYI